MWMHLDYPLIVFAIALVAQSLAVFAGDILRKRSHQLRQYERHDFETVRTTTMTLLALVIGFTFSMAVSRYDQRKVLEEAEANAIGTEYLRADLLPADLGVRTRELLREYLRLRLAYYERGGADIDQQTATAQGQLWQVANSAAAQQPAPIVALVVAGMNDVFNSQGYTEAAWRNRIPVGAWALMGIMAVSSSLLVGFGELRRKDMIVLILPIVISIALFLISDLDSPRGGIIRVQPQNLLLVAQSMKLP